MFDFMFVTNWVFSLALFFMLGFSAHAAMVQKAKATILSEAKEIFLNLIGKNENGCSNTNTANAINEPTSEYDNTEAETEHFGDWGQYDISKHCFGNGDEGREGERVW
ncbi:MAG: hypothetical protein JKY93_03175 [Gammaproteobacteria bacterium]|nr:hypothetical protein [Gammaproteobacteria bacterium]